MTKNLDIQKMLDIQKKIQKLKLLIDFVGEYSSLLNTEAFLNE
jgi:hypothetical protein